jgi:hypothetical protein
MFKRILVSIILGGLFGFISCIFIGTALGTPESMLINAIYLGIISGLLICLILEVNKLSSINKNIE